MGHFFKSKFFLVTVTVAILLVVVISVLGVFGYSSQLRNIANTLLTPAQKGMYYVGEAIEGYSEYITEFDNIKKENEQLKAKINEMNDSVLNAQALIDENEYLKKYLEIKNENLDFKFEAAQIIGREAGNYTTVFTLDKGNSIGISVGMPIITSEGLIGYINEVGINWAKAVSILDSTIAVGAYVERTKEIGIIEGAFDLKDDGLCRLSYLPSDSTIQIGDRILTSGLGNVYPRGLTVGTVKSIETDVNTRQMYAVIEPSANLTSISRVMIVTDYEKYIENN